MDTYLDRAVADRWAGVLCVEDEIGTPTIDDVEQFIEALDAKSRTLVSLYGRDGAYLSLGGGEGQYVVYVSASDELLWNLLAEASQRSGIVLLNAGGQEGDFPARQVVDKRQALQAARVFVRTGQLDSSQRWEKRA